MIYEYIQPLYELSENIYNHQISIEIFNNIILYLKNYENNIKINNVIKYYFNKYILEYNYINIDDSNKKCLYYKENIISLNKFDNFIIFKKNYKNISPFLFDMSDISYTEKYFELIYEIPNTFTISFILIKKDNIIYTNNYNEEINNYSSISFKIYNYKDINCVNNIINKL